MSDGSLDFDMSPAGRFAGALLLWLCYVEIRHTLLQRAAAPGRATIVALVITACIGLPLALAGRLSDRWLVAPAFALLVIGTIRRYPAPGGAARVIRGLLIALRVTALLALLALVARPVYSLTTVVHARPVVDVLIDHSRSLRLRDGSPAKSLPPRRADKLAAALSAARPGRDRLARMADLQIFAFDETSRRLTDWTVADAGAVTGIAAALDALPAKPDAMPAAIVLLSDGRETLSTADAARAAAAKWADRKVPIFAIGVGDPAPHDARRIELADFALPREVVAGGELAVASELRAAGLEGSTLVVECRDGDEIFDRREIVVDKPLLEEKLRFPRHMSRPGFHRIELRARLARPSARPRGDPRAALVRHVLVRDDHVNVLLLEAHPRSESAFITRALAADARFNVTTLFVARTADGAIDAPLPRDIETWTKHHLVILGDLSRGELPRSCTESLARAVSTRGLGLVALAGARQFDLLRSGPLADLAPTEFGPRRLIRDARLRLAPAGVRHVLSQLTSDNADPGAAWARLPPASTACALGEPKPATEVVVASDAGEALLAVMSAGRGRSAALGIDATWRWCMAADDGRAVHARFWRQMAWWAARREPALLLQTDRPRYEWCDVPRIIPAVRIDARFVDPLTGQPPPGTTIEVAIEPVSGAAASAPASQPVRITRDADRWSGVFQPHAAGEYRAVVTARTPDSATAQTAEARFEVVRSDPEIENPAPDFDLLRAIGAVTAPHGGGFYRLENLSECLENIDLPAQRRPIINTQRFALAERFASPLLAILIGALILEWSIRRLRGFV